MKKKPYSNRAFTLIETVLAITVISLVIVATAELTQSSIRIGKSGMEQFISYHLAEEGIEIVRNMRDSNWLQNRPWKYGLSDGKYTIVEYANMNGQKWSLQRISDSLPISLGPYFRKIDISSLEDKLDSAIKITSTVYYQQSGTNRDVSLTTELTDWKKGPL